MADDHQAAEHEIIGNEAPANLSKKDKEQAQAAADFHDQTSKEDGKIQVRVYSPYNDYYDGPAFSVSAENDTGPFDILPNHHNFITLLSTCELLVRTVEKGDQRISISGGIMHVKANQVIVFLDVQISPGD